MVPGGAAARIEGVGLNSMTAAQLQAIMNQMQQLMEGLLGRMQAFKDGR